MAELAQYLTFGAVGELFAVPVERVREILEMRSICRLPHTPTYLLGMLDVRGQSVPVIDLRLKLGFEHMDETENTRIVVLSINSKGRDLLFGLKTDRVFEVAELDDGQLEPPPEIGAKWQSALILGIGRRNGQFVTVIDLDHLLSSDDLAMLEENAA